MEELLHRIEQTAKKGQRHLVVCEGWDARSLKGAAYICRHRIGAVTLLGNAGEIHRQARELGIEDEIAPATIIDPASPATADLRGALADELASARQHRGMTYERAHELLEDVNYLACMLARTGRVDAVAGSAICPTAALMGPALRLLRQDGALVSETSLVHYQGRLYFLTDISNNIAPEAEALAAIAANAGDVAAMFGAKPRIAFLSFSTKGSGGDHASLQRIRDAVAQLAERRPTFIADGELQLDAAVNPDAARAKCPDSPLRGKANVLVFPDLHAANIFGHGLLLFSSATFSFTVLKGLCKPVAVLGRSVSEDLVRNMMLAALAQ